MRNVASPLSRLFPRRSLCESFKKRSNILIYKNKGWERSVKVSRLCSDFHTWLF